MDRIFCLGVKAVHVYFRLFAQKHKQNGYGPRAEVRNSNEFAIIHSLDKN